MQMYDGDIYKTRILRNQSLMQQFPTDSLLRHAQDSIENTLEAFDKQLWVLTPEEKAALEEAAAAQGDENNGEENKEKKEDKKRSVKKTETKTEKADSGESKSQSRSSRSGAKTKKPKQQKSSSDNAPVRSVRRTK
jgi:hypothetical protein